MTPLITAIQMAVTKVMPKNVNRHTPHPKAMQSATSFSIMTKRATAVNRILLFIALMCFTSAHKEPLSDLLFKYTFIYAELNTLVSYFEKTPLKNATFFAFLAVLGHFCRKKTPWHGFCI